MAEKQKPGTAREMQSFLPRDNTAVNGNKYKITGQDYEASMGEFDPFRARVLEHPVSNMGTLAHLLKAALGTGILSMPAAFQGSGLIFGIFSTIAVAIICTHCAYVLVVCAHELYVRAGKTQMGFAETAEEACLRGPKWIRGSAKAARMIVQISLFITYFFTCSCYCVIIAKNITYVLDYHMGYTVSVRLTIAVLLVPLILLAFVPNLKYLVPFSMLANLCMLVGLGITFYYLVNDIPPISDREYVGSISTIPISVSVVIFAIEAIGVVMPLENNMATPRSFIGICGVMVQGMTFVTFCYILLGFFGYLKYGTATEGSITYNLPKEAIPAQVVNILVAIAVFFTFGLQFYVCLDIAWNGVKEKCTKHPILCQYSLRAIMVVLCVALAIAVPTIVPFVGLIGAFCFSILGLIVPVFLEIITFWDKGFGRFNWKILKNIVVFITGLLALIFGSKTALEEIAALYIKK